MRFNSRIFFTKSFDDLGAEIPSDDIYDMWLHKVANDPYLCPGYLKLSSPEFRTVAITGELFSKILL